MSEISFIIFRVLILSLKLFISIILIKLLSATITLFFANLILLIVSKPEMLEYSLVDLLKIVKVVLSKVYAIYWSLIENDEILFRLNF